MEGGMRRNPKAEIQRHRRWTQHTRGWANYPYRGSYYRYMQRYFNRKERRHARVDLSVGREPYPWQPKGRVKWEVW